MPSRRAVPGELLSCPEKDCKYRCMTQASLNRHLTEHADERRAAELATAGPVARAALGKRTFLRTAIYARKSPSGENTRDGLAGDPEQQLIEARRHVTRDTGLFLLWEGADQDVSGDVPLFNRPAGEKLWSLVKGGQVDVLVVWSLSRLSREDPLDVLIMLRNLDKWHVKLVSVCEPFLNSYPQNTMPEELRETLAFLWALQNHKYVKDVRIATRRAKRLLSREGKPMGRHPKGCGVPAEKGGWGPCPTGNHGPDGKPRRGKVAMGKAPPSKKKGQKRGTPPLRVREYEPPLEPSGGT